MRDDCLSKPWATSGNQVVTRIIQPDSGLPYLKHKVLATTSYAVDEEGVSLSPVDKAELARKISALPELISLAREILHGNPRWEDPWSQEVTRLAREALVKAEEDEQ